MLRYNFFAHSVKLNGTIAVSALERTLAATFFSTESGSCFATSAVLATFSFPTKIEFVSILFLFYHNAIFQAKRARRIQKTELQLENGHRFASR